MKDLQGLNKHASAGSSKRYPTLDKPRRAAPKKRRLRPTLVNDRLVGMVNKSGVNQEQSVDHPDDRMIMGLANLPVFVAALREAVSAQLCTIDGADKLLGLVRVQADGSPSRFTNHIVEGVNELLDDLERLGALNPSIEVNRLVIGDIFLRLVGHDHSTAMVGMYIGILAGMGFVINNEEQKRKDRTGVESEGL